MKKYYNSPDALAIVITSKDIISASEVGIGEQNDDIIDASQVWG